MKNIILLLLSISINVHAHTNNPIEVNDYVSFVKQYGYWAILEETNELIFCFGVTSKNKPACTTIPNKYIVIELPSNLQ